MYKIGINGKRVGELSGNLLFVLGLEHILWRDNLMPPTC
jgi:hypothetical protein